MSSKKYVKHLSFATSQEEVWFELNSAEHPNLVKPSESQESNLSKLLDPFNLTKKSHSYAACKYFKTLSFSAPCYLF